MSTHDVDNKRAVPVIRAHPFPSTRTPRLLIGLALLAAVWLGLPSGVGATNGYFQHGYGAASKAMGGTGAALSLDALAPAVNPAGIAFTGDRVDGSLTFFHPSRSATVDGVSTQPGNLLRPGRVDSDRPLFFLPSAGIAHQVGARWAVGLALFGNGGINTTYPGFARRCPDPRGGGQVAGSGLFCGGEAGVDLTQIFLAPTAAYEAVDGWSIGVSPVLAYQRFTADGLQAFAPLSQDPDALTNNGVGESVGAGVRVGIQGAVTEWLRLGASYQSRIHMTRFEDYAGLFAEQGDFDIPPSWTVGVAVRPVESLWLLADVQHIAYDAVAAVGNDFATGQPLGADGGPGFGWDSMTVLKLGAQWQATASLTLRAGFSTTDQPVPEDQLLFNVLAPGVVEEHFTGGLDYRLGPAWSLNLSMMYAPEVTVAGANPVDPAQRISAELSEFEATLGVSWRY